jgi:hypothetical protein
MESFDDAARWLAAVDIAPRFGLPTQLPRGRATREEAAGMLAKMESSIRNVLGEIGGRDPEYAARHLQRVAAQFERMWQCVRPPAT